MNGTTSFIIGWNYGRKNGRELSPREISVQFPDVDHDAFAQGNVDGILKDRFRLDLLLARKVMVA